MRPSIFSLDLDFGIKMSFWRWAPTLRRYKTNMAANSPIGKRYFVDARPKPIKVKPPHQHRIVHNGLMFLA